MIFKELLPRIDILSTDVFGKASSAGSFAELSVSKLSIRGSYSLKIIRGSNSLTRNPWQHYL